MKELNTTMSKDLLPNSVKNASAEFSSHVIYRKCAKRTFDFVLSGLGIVLFAAPMVIVAGLVKCTSKGPIFFRQTRFGRDSMPFTLVKFRSMYIEAPEKANKDFSKEAMAHYVTPIGRFMRKSSLDELPQLFNVFTGKMSFIGPRPLAKTDARVIELRQQNGADRVRPGITGLAQINGRNEVSDEDKADYDAQYARQFSFWFDLKILLQSVVVVLSQRGINKKGK
ncbi:sugar transferase [Lacticaseibacillus daqingensis]|uniref:sugar transferase n=1 Tax=Lacticaseibacillus daqingensis TaxID=2486014 RepID=UPI001CDD3A7F|nr:sugar transferase [Lacticaseibacillus daqingensis]